MKYLTYIFFVVFLFFSKSAKGSVEKLMAVAEMNTGVPAKYIKATCTHESKSFYKGKKQPWPWTLNVEGKGIYFKNKDAAVTYANLYISKGKKNLDIGMCQINWYWHGQQFNSVAELIEPLNNVIYAANYLKKLSKGKTWEYAIGAYHSPSNPKRAKAYLKKVLSE